MAILGVHSVTINTAQIDTLLQFYTTLGLSFQTKKVSLGSMIYRAKVGSIEVTLYGIKSKEVTGTPPIQLGFELDNVEEVFHRLSSLPNVTVLLDPVSFPDGTRAIVLDPDGHSVELLQRSPELT